MQSKFCNGLENLEIFEIQPDTPCCCLFASVKRFYRAIILDVDYLEELATVLYVDYGNQEKINFKLLNSLKILIISFPNNKA